MIYDDKLAQAAYLIGCQRTGEALIIDPERDIDRYLEIARREGMRITAIAETHIHADFLSGARELAEKTGAKLYLSDEGTEDWKYRWLDRKIGGGSYDHQLLHNGDRFNVGNIRIEAVHTPGHTPEHLSFLVTDLGGGADEPIGIVTGDFVFVGDVGRPDLLETAAGQAGAKEPAAHELYSSVNEFLKLPDYLQIWPAHGAGSACGKELGAVPQSTVGYERRFNPALLNARDGEEIFVESILAGQPEPPMYFSRMKRENREGPAVLGSLPVPTRISASELAAAVAGDSKAIVIDTRPWMDFAAGHLAGSLYAPYNRTFPTVAGSYIPADVPIYLVIERERLRDAVVDLIRIGLDNIAGYVTPSAMGEEMSHEERAELTPWLTAIEFRDHLQTNHDSYVLDVRNSSEFTSGHLEQAHNIAYTRLPEHLSEIPTGRPVYVHCQSGARSAVATAYLRRNGVKAINVAGGFGELQRIGLPIVRDGVAEPVAG
jgi:hydroxyacylglutathione hydrolase